MNSIIIFLCAVLIGALAHHLPENEKRKLKEIHDACQAQPSTYADEALLKKLTENVNNKKVAVHMLCMAVKEGLVTQNGELLKDVIKSKIALVTHDSSKVDGLLKKCAVKYETPEKTATLLVVCFVQNNIHYYHVL